MCVSGILGGASIVSGLVGADSAGDAADAALQGTQQQVALQDKIYEQTVDRYEPFYEGGLTAFEALLYEMGLGPRPTVGGDPLEVVEFQDSAESFPTFEFGRGRNTTPEDLATGAQPLPENITRYRVGDQVFNTRAAANEYAAANAAGGTQYGGYEASPMFRYLMETGVENIEAGAAAAGGLYSGATAEAMDDYRYDMTAADLDRYIANLFGMTSIGTGAAGNQSAAGANYAAGASNAIGQGAAAQANAAIAQGNAWQGMFSDLAGVYGYSQSPMAAYAAPTASYAPTTSLRPQARPI